MTGYKAYDHGLTCRGKQYEVGKVYEEDKAVICECGMHYCDNPADLMFYHDLLDASGSIMDVTEVEDLAPDTADYQQDGQAKKYCTTKIKIGAKVDFKDWVKAAVGFLLERTSSDEKGSKASSEDFAQLASSGYRAQLASSGNFAQLASSGDFARLASSGDDSVIAAIGIDNKAKGAVGNWITLAEWEYDEKKCRYVPKCVKTEYVDGTKIKADTWYVLRDGEFKED